MRNVLFAVVIAMGASLAVAVWARLRRAAADERRARAKSQDDECAVRECAADGVPLSLYAG